MAKQLQEFSGFFTFFKKQILEATNRSGSRDPRPQMGGWQQIRSNCFAFCWRRNSGGKKVDQRQTNFKSLIKAAGDVTKATPSIGSPVGKIRSASDLFPARLTFLPYQGIKDTEKFFVRLNPWFVSIFLQNFTKNFKRQSENCTKNSVTNQLIIELWPNWRRE